MIYGRFLDGHIVDMVEGIKHTMQVHFSDQLVQLSNHIVSKQPRAQKGARTEQGGGESVPAG